MKNVSRNKLLLCFRPVVDMEDVLVQSKGAVDCCVNGRLTYFDVDKKEKTKTSENSTIVRPPKRIFSRAIKAIVFQTILTKRVREKKVFDRRESQPSKTRFFNREEYNSTCQEKKANMHQSRSLLCESSSDCSTSTWEYVNSSEQIKQNHEYNNQELSTDPRDVKMGSSGFNSGVIFILISFTSTVFLGKLCAIFTTLIWLYVFPGQYIDRRLGYVTKLSETEIERDQEDDHN